MDRKPLVVAEGTVKELPPGDTVSSDVVAEGSTNLFFTAARVRAAVLTGLSTATNVAIAATDTVLEALGKLQTQINGRIALDLSNVTSSVSSVDGTETFVVSQGGVPKTSLISKIRFWLINLANTWPEKQKFTGGVELPDTAIGNNHSVAYTPTAVAITNVSSITTYPTIAVRTVDGVIVGSRVDVNATAAGRIVFRLSLPVASDITSSEQVAGTFHVYTTGSVVAGGCISGLASTNDAEFRGVAAAAGNASYWYNYIYKVN